MLLAGAPPVQAQDSLSRLVSDHGQLRRGSGTVGAVTCELTALPGPSSVAVAENDYGRVATYTASFEEGYRPWWSVVGPDAAHFDIGAPPGVLRFRTGPEAPGRFGEAADYENPRDEGGDNTYEVTVVAAAPGGVCVAQAVSVEVTVADVDEPGAVGFSTARPRVGEALAATLHDPDTPAAVSWVWERSAGPNTWAAIEGATEASYTPVAADAGEFLRVTARYRDRHGAAKTAVAGLHHVVVADLLSSLTVSTEDSTARSDPWAGWRGQRPGFDGRTLHYSVGCGDADTMTLRFAAADAASRLAVDGIAYANPGAGRPVTAQVPVGGRSEVTVSVAGEQGAVTRYVVHCLHEDMAPFTAERSPGATEQLLLAAVGSDLLILDANGVPRRIIDVGPAQAGPYFRFYPDVGGEHRYSYSVRDPNAGFSGVHVVLDENLEALDEVTTAAPLLDTGTHDFGVLRDGGYLLLAAQPATRDYSHLTFADVNGEPFGTETWSMDSAIQILTAHREALLTWNSFDHIALEDCTQHWFPPANPRWAHLNSVGIHHGVLVASFRGCNQVLGIDPDTGQVIWRVGHTNQHEPGFASPPPDPAPLAIVGDPQGQFCGQHAAHLTAAGRLLLFDNGAACSRNPWTGQNPLRPDRTYSRAVEYRLDLDHGEAVYVREHSLGGTQDRIGWLLGHVEPLEGGDWLISWGSERLGAPAGPPYPVNDTATATQADPATGAELLTLRWQVPLTHDVRVTAMPAWALARQPQTPRVPPPAAALPAAAQAHEPSTAQPAAAAHPQPADPRPPGDPTP
ncbi:aryl-sulfate sulfotransferase [Candidatus Spongiisocius sp.]|uniref:aryl-sulfate sulfotransferase n=1 Tax=Candidatus Spongiisocius sp. TaxID=3101273 RepID=UPI003B5AC2BE